MSYATLPDVRAPVDTIARIHELLDKIGTPRQRPPAADAPEGTEPVAMDAAERVGAFIQSMHGLVKNTTELGAANRAFAQHNTELLRFSDWLALVVRRSARDLGKGEVRRAASRLQEAVKRMAEAEHAPEGEPAQPGAYAFPEPSCLASMTEHEKARELRAAIAAGHPEDEARARLWPAPAEPADASPAPLRLSP